MEQRTAIWRDDEDRQRWLSTLIQAMDEAARPEVRTKPCPPAVLAALRAQLARPVSQNSFARGLRLQPPPLGSEMCQLTRRQA